MSTGARDQQADVSPDVQQGPPRAVPRGLEAYPSLQAAFAAPQPLHSYGVQTHKSERQARIVAKTPTNSKPSDNQLPRYQHETDLALAVDVAVLWRALDSSPAHASYTREKCKFNHSVDYLGDTALVAKLQTLPDFPALKAFLVEVLEPPPRPAAKNDSRASGLKRKRADSGRSGGTRQFWVDGDVFYKQLSDDNLKGCGGAVRLHLTTATMRAKPFEWQPADPTSTAPPTMLISCKELGVVNADATVGKRTDDGYRLGKGTQELLGKLKAKPDDIMQLRATKKEGDTIYVDLQLERTSAAAPRGGSTGGAPSAGGAAAAGSTGQAPSINGTAARGQAAAFAAALAAGVSAAGVPAAAAPAAAPAAAAPAAGASAAAVPAAAASGVGAPAAAAAAEFRAAVAPEESTSPSRQVSRSDYGSDDDDEEVQIVGDTQQFASMGAQLVTPDLLAGQAVQRQWHSSEALAVVEEAEATAVQAQQQKMQQAQEQQVQQQAQQQQKQPRGQQQPREQQQAQPQAMEVDAAAPPPQQTLGVPLPLQLQQAQQRAEDAVNEVDKLVPELEQEMQRQQAQQQAHARQTVAAPEQQQQQQPPEQQTSQQQQQQHAQQTAEQEQQREEPTPQQHEQQALQQQQHHIGEGRGATSGRAAAPGASSCPAAAHRAKLAEQLLQRRLQDAVDALVQAATSAQRLPPLLSLAAVGHGGVLMQEIWQRWTQLSEDSREVIADAVASVPLHADGQQQLLPQLHLALDAAGESWHRSIAKGSGATNSAGADGPNPAVVAKWQQRAAQACEDAAAALAARPADVTSQMLLRPLSLLALGYIGGAPLKEAVAGWAGYNHAQQRALFESAMVAVHQGAWQQLEARMQAALQLLPYLADKP